jgi:transposase-like protein
LDPALCPGIRETLESLRPPVGRSWRVDETYVKIKGRWTYLYRAVDKEGKTVDFLLRAKRDIAAAKAFFRRALQRQGQLPYTITLDGYQASHRGAAEALSEHPEGNQCKIRSSKYLNNLIEQDHRSIKLRLGPMLGLKHFRRAATTIVGIELIHRIRKVSSNSTSFTSNTKPLPRFGMRCSLRDRGRLPGPELARPLGICTRT